MPLTSYRTQFYSQQQGIVLVETLLVVPVLVLVFAIILHFSSMYYVVTAMEKSVRIAARQLAQGKADEITSGVITACNSLDESHAATAASAEYLACSQLHFGAESLTVTAFDGNSSGPASVGTAVYVELQLPNSALLSIVPSAMAIGPDTFIARATQYAEEVAP